MPLFLLLIIFFSHLVETTAQKKDVSTIIVLDSLRAAAIEKGDFENATAISEKSVVESKRLYGTLDTNYAKSLVNLVEVYMYTGKIAECKSLCKEALEIVRKAVGTKDKLYINNLSWMAYVYFYLSDYPNAEACFAESLKLCEEVLGKNHSDYSTGLNNLAVIYSSTNRYTEAEPLLLEALAIALALDGEYSDSYVLCLNTLASLYTSMERYTDILSLKEKVVAIYAKTVGKNHQNYASGLHNLGYYYQILGEHEKAEKLLLESIAIFKKTFGENNDEYAQSIRDLANLYIDMKQFDKAEELFLKSSKIFDKIYQSKNPENAISLERLVALYLGRKQYDKAFEFLLKNIYTNNPDFDTLPTDLHELLDLTTNTTNYYNHYVILQNLFQIYELCKATDYPNPKFKEVKMPFLICRDAIKLGRNLMNTFVATSDKLNSISNSSYFIGLGLEEALLLDSLEKTNQYKEEVFSFIEQNKALTLLESVKSEKAKTFGDIPTAVVEEEQLLAEKFSELNKLYLESKDAPSKNQYTQELNEVNLKIRTLKQTIKEKHPKYYNFKYSNTFANVAEIQKHLPKDAALLEYFVNDSTFYIYCITKESVSVEKNSQVAELSKQIKNFREALSNYAFITQKTDEAYNLYTQTGYWLYENLVKKVKNLKNINHLIIIPDQGIGHIPFEAFLTKAIQNVLPYSELPYLLNDYKISYNYSATVWKENLEGHPNKNGKMLALAASYSISKLDSTTLQNNRSPHLSKLRHSLIELPAAQEEVQVLEKSFVGDFLFGKDANENHFKNHAKDYAIIHLAMHGILNQQTPILSSLAFTENHDSLHDNFLEAWEIAHLKLNANLVVLSACETGYGKFQQGEGVMSLAHSFMYAGVPSLVVSLWQVNDHSTSVIMQLFYQYLADGMAKDAALQQAKLDYIQMAQGIAGHPAFWSPFIQLGDSRAIAVETQFIASVHVWAIGFAVLLVLGIGGVMLRKRAV